MTESLRFVFVKNGTPEVYLPWQMVFYLTAGLTAGVVVSLFTRPVAREHTIIGTTPSDTRKEADEAVRACGWDGPYFVDADHIGLGNIDEFIESSDFFTLDVADFIGEPADKSDVDSFVQRHKKFIGSLAIPGVDETFDITEERLRTIAGKFLLAVKQAGRIYRHIEAARGADNFITEVSMDETLLPRTPVEMFFILAAIAAEGIPGQTIAPKFTGRFNKGVDYVGDVTLFAKEFESDLAVVAFAVKEFGLPENLKLSIHSGSDKFSIYGPIAKALTLNSDSNFSRAAAFALTTFSCTAAKLYSGSASNSSGGRV